jgi:type IV pilus assembly protein PilW
MKPQRGFSLIELMIAVTIGLLAVLAATVTMTSFESNKRNSVSSSDAMQNGYLATFAIEADASKAGWGLNDSWLIGCPTLMYDARLPAGSGAYPLGLAGGGPQVLAPAIINSSNGAAPDQISFYSGASSTGTGALAISGGNYSGDNNPILVSTPTPTFFPGDVYVVAAPPQPTPRPNCLIGQVSDIAVGTPNQLFHAAGFIAGSTFQTRFNNAGGLAPGTTYDQSAKVFNLGPGEPGMNRGSPPTFRTWFVQNGSLMIRASEVLTGNQVIDSTAVGNIVNLKAQYGIQPAGGALVWSNTLTDSDGDGVVGSAGDWLNVVAIRVAVVARSREVDKPAAGGTTCATTAVAPRAFDQPPGSGLPVSVAVAGDTANWTCYRYRVFETVIPLRNVTWRPS